MIASVASDPQATLVACDAALLERIAWLTYGAAKWLIALKDNRCSKSVRFINYHLNAVLKLARRESEYA